MRAKNILAAFEHIEDCRVNLLLEIVVLPYMAVETDFHGCSLLVVTRKRNDGHSIPFSAWNDNSMAARARQSGTPGPAADARGNRARVAGAG